MGITINDVAARVSYVATAGQTVFTGLGFKFFADSDLQVYKNGTLLTLTTHYTVQGANADTGMGITLVTGATLSDVILVVRALPYERTTEVATTGPLNVAAINTFIGKLVMMVQQLRDKLGRSPTLATSDTDGAGAYLANGNRISNLGTPTATTDATTKAYVDTADAVNAAALAAAMLAAGNVPAPGASFTGKWLKALSATTWGWTTPLWTAAEIASDAITTIKILDANVTLAKIVSASGASKLLGRGSAGGAGVFQELTLGSNLTLTGTVLDGKAGTVTGVTAADTSVTIGGTGAAPTVAVAKPLGASAYCTQSGTTLTQVKTFNATVARTGVGIYSVTFGTALPDANYMVQVTAQLQATGVGAGNWWVTARTVNGFTLQTLGATGSGITDLTSREAGVLNIGVWAQ